MHLHGQKQYFTVQPTILIEKTQPMVEKLRPEYGKTQINVPKLRSDFSKTQPLEFFKLSQIQLHCTKNKPESWPTIEFANLKHHAERIDTNESSGAD